MAFFAPLTHLREAALVPDESALVVIDVQNFCCHPDGAAWRQGGKDSGEPDCKRREPHFWDTMPKAVENVAALIAAFRAKGMEVIYTTIESLTANGRDRSFDYKVSGFNVPRGSWDARVLDQVAPLGDEIVLPKTSCSVFISTTLPYILRNMCVRQVTLCGGLTDQCVDSAVRDACDMGFLVTLVPDACYTYSGERHDASIRAVNGYCRKRPAAELCAELDALPAASPWGPEGFRLAACTKDTAAGMGEPPAKKATLGLRATTPSAVPQPQGGPQ